MAASENGLCPNGRLGFSFADVRGRGGFLAMAGGERRDLSRSLAEVRQARGPRNDDQQDRGDRLRAGLRMGRRPTWSTGRTLLQDPVHAPAAWERLVAAEPRAGRETGEGGSYATAWPGAGRAGEGGWQVGGGLRRASQGCARPRPDCGAGRRAGRAPAVRRARRRQSVRGAFRVHRGTIERAVIMADEEVLQPKDLIFSPLEAPSVSENEPAELKLSAIEKNTILKVIEKHNGNITKAAKELGLTRTALYRRLSKYDI